MQPLPRPPTSFIGRDEELARLVAHLERGMRLVTLTGLGGVGKTRLALAAAARLAEAPARRKVTFCDTVGLHSVPELAMALAGVLDLEIGGLDRVPPHLAVARALARAGRGPLLVVVDNFEHLAQVATDALIDLLAQVPELQLLVTTRVALMRPEELALPVHPLPADRPDSPAVMLLRARARGDARSPWASDDDALMRLATRLDGLPLALELAAARAHLVTPDALLALLDERVSLALPGVGDGHPRKSSRDAAVAWSWDQLGPERASALGRLALLDGSFDLDLAADVIGGSRATALEVLDVLARHSLLAPEQHADGVRYRVLETVRDFALAQLDAAAIGRAHEVIAEALLARVEPHLSAFSRELPPAIAAQVARDRDLYLGVLRRGLTTDDLGTLALALRVAIALVPFLQRAGFTATATDWASRLLAHARSDEVALEIRLNAALVTVVAAAGNADDTLVDRLVARVASWLDRAGRARMLPMAFGVVHYYRWDHPTLLTLADAVLRSSLAHESVEVRAYALAAQVGSRRALGRASASDDEALAEVLTRLPRESATTICLLILTRAFLAIHLGEPTRGLALVAEGLARAGGTLKYFEALFHLERGRALCDLGRRDEAEAAMRHALESFDPRGAQRERQETLLDLALVAIERGDYQRAARDLAASEADLGTSFERAWHHALSHASARLGARARDDAAIATAPAPTGTVEDGACQALLSIGDPGAADRLAAIEPSTRHSFRARRALNLATALRSLERGESDGAIAIANDSSAFRAGRSWVDVSTRPLIRALLHALAEARLAGRAGVDRAELAEVMWPDERLNDESRDQRLHTAVSTLRRLGLESAVEAHDGGYRLSPERTLVRLDPERWPGPGGALERARGRGRPPRR